MKKLIVVAAATVLLASCKTSKSSCEAYGRVKVTSTTKHITRR
jgi:uncharacterized lipoprotein YajG